VITAWRIVKERYAQHAFSGEGSRLYGTRWTSPGVRVTLVSETCSLATLEILVHLGQPQILHSYVALRVEFDEELVSHLDGNLLPSDWRTFPSPPELRAIGDDWARSRASAILRVPSAVVETEFNYILNPDHPEIDRVSCGPPEPFAVDSRLLGH